MLLPMAYKYKEYIFEALTNALSGPSNYSKTYDKIIDNLRVKISHRDYSRHLDRMVREHWIHKDDSRTRGSSVKLELTEKAKNCKQLKIGFSMGNRYEKAYQLLLNQASLGSTHLIKMTEPQAGYAFSISAATQNVLGILTTETLEGVSENDLIERKHHGSGGIFHYLVFTENEVREYFNLLIDSKILIPIVAKPELRYSIILDLRKFFVDCWYMIPDVLYQDGPRVEKQETSVESRATMVHIALWRKRNND